MDGHIKGWYTHATEHDAVTAVNLQSQAECKPTPKVPHGVVHLYSFLEMRKL